MSDRSLKIVAGPFGAFFVGLTITVIFLHRTSEERIRTAEVQMATRISQVEARMDQLAGALDARLRRTETVMAGQEAKKAALEKEREDLTENAGRHIRIGEPTIYQHSGGFFSSTSSQILSVSLENRSQFNVTGLRGMWECRNASKDLLAAVPAEIGGALMAGQTATMTVSSGAAAAWCDEKASRLILRSATVLGGE